TSVLPRRASRVPRTTSLLPPRGRRVPHRRSLRERSASAHGAHGARREGCASERRPWARGRGNGGRAIRAGVRRARSPVPEFHGPCPPLGGVRLLAPTPS